MIRFNRLRKEDLEVVLKWRTTKDVTRYMFGDVDYNMKKQKQWFDKISTDSAYRYWMIYYEDIPVGLINLAAVDKINLRCNAGYYIGDMRYRQLGAMIPPYLYNYVFRKMKFKKIYGEVMAENKKVLEMHKIHGFRFVGTYKDHIFKYGKFHDVVLIELLSEVWLKQKKYDRYVSEFE